MAHASFALVLVLCLPLSAHSRPVYAILVAPFKTCACIANMPLSFTIRSSPLPIIPYISCCSLICCTPAAFFLQASAQGRAFQLSLCCAPMHRAGCGVCMAEPCPQAAHAHTTPLFTPQLPGSTHTGPDGPAGQCVSSVDSRPYTYVTVEVFSKARRGPPFHHPPVHLYC